MLGETREGGGVAKNPLTIKKLGAILSGERDLEACERIYSIILLKRRRCESGDRGYTSF
jgi:hypothetical protein